MNRTIRHATSSDIHSVVKYFAESDDDFLYGMGIDPKKNYDVAKWTEILIASIEKPFSEKEFFYLLWELDGIGIGHSNINRLEYGVEAYMHLHVWDSEDRRKGHGKHFVKLCVPEFIKLFKLKKLYCEPNANNPGPNKTLEKAGFRYVSHRVATPGDFHYEQPLNLWVWD